MPAADRMPAPRPFTGMRLDRASTERKDPAWVRRLLDDPGSRAVSATADGVLVGNGGTPGLIRAPLVPGETAVLLGLDRDGRALFGRDLEDDPDGAPGEGQVVSLREAGSALPHAEGGLAAYLVALLGWHRRHRFCANCGHATDIAEAGYSRHCPSCTATHFPRTDPVVIMTVEHDGRLLLGRRTGWPEGRLSVLAGFVSPGESAEEAVIREVQEESGIVSRDPVFIASQPWPFPASLMLGFHATSDGGVPRGTDGELDEVHWVALEAVRRSARGENPDFQLPPPVSIARFLIDRWLVSR